MIIDNALNKWIADVVVDADIKNRAEHVSSGKLSASGLGEPLQWQILKALQITERQVDEYTLRKFQRGKDVEDRVLSWLPVSGKQEFVEYRGVVGYMDAMVDSAFWWTSGLPKGEMPLELKSVTNAKFKRIVGQGNPDKGHILQACLYGLAKNSEWTSIAYVASDDYRVQSFLVKVADYKYEIDEIIDRFNTQLMKMQIPVFEPREAWQATPKYNKFPEFATLSQEELDKILLEELKKKHL